MAYSDMIMEEVIADLDAFVPIDEAHKVGQLYEILDRLASVAPELRTPVIPAIFRLIERHPNAELGSPGPLVHELEGMPSYQSFLSESISRQPASLNIWMINRILNTELHASTRVTWIGVLETALQHPLASEESKEFITYLLAHQSE